jgi:hypothetical protein
VRIPARDRKADTLPGPADLVDQFTDLVLGSDDPRLLAERALAIVVTLTRARCAAVFRAVGSGLALFASGRLDQPALDHAHADWAAAAARLRRGEIVLRSAVSPGDAPSRGLAPIHGASGLLGVLYLDSFHRAFLDEEGCRRVRRFAAILARALDAPPPPAGRSARGWESGPHAADGAAERGTLLALLEDNEWNIARVARILRVTRRTVYLRLGRFGIPREKVRKGPGGPGPP